jgi:biofilm PGA synthesis protein PgaA
MRSMSFATWGFSGRARVWLAVMGLGLLAASLVAAQSVSQQREAAILKARAGQMAEAQAALRALLAAGAEDGFVAMDLAALLQQDGKAAEAVAVFEKAAPADPPDYALLAVTRAYRDLQRFDDAARLARQGLQRFPGQSDWVLLLSLVLSDAGRSAEAIEIVRGPAARGAPPIERLLAEGYAWRRGGDPYKAMEAYREAIRLAPDNVRVRAEAAAVMQGMGAPFVAETIAGRLTPSIAADQAAVMVRWGASTQPSDPARRFEGTDAALARLDALLASLPAEEKTLRRRVRLDRLVALRDRVRMQELVDDAKALAADEPLPPYAEQAYADALLHLRRPEEARDAYRRVLAKHPKELSARYGVFYASAEIEDFTTAYATIDAIVAEQPIWRQFPGDATRHQNNERVDAEVMAAQARFYANDLAEAWARIDKLSAAAPAHVGARFTLYQVASARGWKQRATEEGEIAASLEPDSVTAKMAAIEIAIANYRFAEAQRLIAPLLALYPENLAVQRLARDLDAKRRWLLEVEVKPGNSTGGGDDSSGRTVTSEARLYSPPIADNWRLTALADYSNAHPVEGFVERSRAGIGLDWRVPGLAGSLYATNSWGTFPKAGGGATLAWAVTDEIEIGVGAAWFSTDTPLRALFYGITADTYSAHAVYRWHESRRLAAVFAYQPFTDGNRRLTGGLSFEERLLSLPGFVLTGRVGAYASSNSLVDAPYYNPVRDLSLTGGFLAEHTLWRRYDNSLVHALSVDAGLYSEQGYRDDWLGTVNYEHRWRFDPLTEFRYGAVLRRRVYDGDVENSLTLFVGLRQRI